MKIPGMVSCAVVAVIVGAGPGAELARANLTMYADSFGVDVNFTNIVETSTVAGTYYGQPVSIGNTAVSPGTGFLSQSASGQLELVNGRLQMTITADPGFSFSSIQVNQLGSYFGFGNDAMVMASANATVVTPDGNYAGSLLFANPGTGTGPWASDFTVSFPETTVAAFTLDHQLFTTAGTGSAAFIDTSSIQISVGAFAVPETGTAALLALTMTGLGIGRRRRRE